MYIVGFVGSPRHGGNTDTLVDEVLKGASKEGAVTRKYSLAGMEIHPCTACDACKPRGECVFEDDMVELAREMEKADVYVIGTPVYFWGPSAQLKAFVDRWYSLQEKGASFMNGKKAALVCTHEDASKTTAQHIVGMFRESFKYLKVDFVDQLLVSIDGKGEVKKDRDAMEAARRLGGTLSGTP
ncbi:MAG: flavodoxin family protein [Bacillota bacterium]